MTDMQNYRKPTYEIASWILNRWSPRAMSGEKIDEKELMALFEAARWAPSSYNGQPWRFLYAKKGTSHWQTFFDLLGDFNKQWAQHAGVLLVIISKKTFEHNNKPSITHRFDTGAAWENLALEGSRRGLVVHGMEGFDYEKARTALKIPDDYDIEAMAAIDKHGKKDVLPKEMQEREVPSGRKPIADLIIEGPFQG